MKISSQKLDLFTYKKIKSKHGNTRKSMGIRSLMKHLWPLTVYTQRNKDLRREKRISMGYAYSNNKDKDIKRPNQITALGHSKPECGFIARVSSRSIMNATGKF